MSETEQERRNRLHEMYAAQQGDNMSCALQLAANVTPGGGSFDLHDYPIGIHNTVPQIGSLHEPSPERLIAIRTELIRLSHCNGDTPERIVARADAYLSFILNGTPKESIVDGED